MLKKQKSPWKPGLIAISVDGNTSYMFRHPLHVTQVDSKAYWGIAISNCKKKIRTRMLSFCKWL
jgi:hypothetical protein